MTHIHHIYTRLAQRHQYIYLYSRVSLSLSGNVKQHRCRARKSRAAASRSRVREERGPLDSRALCHLTLIIKNVALSFGGSRWRARELEGGFVERAGILSPPPQYSSQSRVHTNTSSAAAWVVSRIYIYMHYCCCWRVLFSRKDCLSCATSDPLSLSLVGFGALDLYIFRAIFIFFVWHSSAMRKLALYSIHVEPSAYC